MCRGRANGKRLRAGELTVSAWQKSADGIVGTTCTEGSHLNDIEIIAISG
jgi:hypothetical protein